VAVGFVDKDSPLGRVYQEHKEQDPFYREATLCSTRQLLSLLRRARFYQPQVIQTMFGRLGDIDTVQDFKSGCGEGASHWFRHAKARESKTRRLQQTRRLLLTPGENGAMLIMSICLKPGPRRHELQWRDP
jgi:hypothetical protein